MHKLKILANNKYKKILVYGGLAIATPAIVITFLTAQSYLQLAAASLFYVLLTFFIYKLLPNQIRRVPVTKVFQDNSDVMDMDKRGFLKLIGAAGLSFFIFSLFNRRVEIPFLGNIAGAKTGTVADFSQNASSPLPVEGYNISEIDDDVVAYYGFINKNGEWLIMKEDRDTGSFRYAKGNLEFPKNWNDRKQLKYDYYHNLD